MATIEEIRNDIDSVYIDNNNGEITPSREKAIMHKILDVVESFGSVFDGSREISSIPALGQQPGGTTVAEFLNNVFYKAQAPDCSISISGGGIREFTGTDMDPEEEGIQDKVTLNWSVTKRTNTILSLSVAGINLSPTGSSESGVLDVTFPANVNRNFTITVSDGTNSTSKNASLAYRHGMYWGALPAIGSITDSNILSLSKELRTDRLKTFTGIDGEGDYLVFAFPSSWGTPQFIVNGLPNSAYTKVRDNAFVNSLGYSENYQVWASNTVQFGATNIEIK